MRAPHLPHGVAWLVVNNNSGADNNGTESFPTDASSACLICLFLFDKCHLRLLISRDQRNKTCHQPNGLYSDKHQTVCVRFSVNSCLSLANLLLAFECILLLYTERITPSNFKKGSKPLERQIGFCNGARITRVESSSESSKVCESSPFEYDCEASLQLEEPR